MPDEFQQPTNTIKATETLRVSSPDIRDIHHSNLDIKYITKMCTFQLSLKKTGAVSNQLHVPTYR